MLKTIPFNLDLTQLAANLSNNLFFQSLKKNRATEEVKNLLHEKTQALLSMFFFQLFHFHLLLAIRRILPVTRHFKDVQ